MTTSGSSGGVPQAVPNSSMAIISLVSGILGLSLVPLIGSIVAVITGPMAKREIRESGGMLAGEGMATAGIVLGWIGIAMSLMGLCVACFIFVLLPLGFLGAAGEFNSYLPMLLVG